MDWKNKRVLVFGAGKSGIGAVDILKKLGASPVLYDGNEKLDTEVIRGKLADKEGVDICLGELPSKIEDSLSLIIMSPGVPCDLPIVLRWKEKGLPVWGELELAYRLGKGTVLVGTGTNGKTTTTALLGEIMKAARPEVYVVGNIGNPYTEAALLMSEEAVTVAEVSSFQLETIEEFHPKASVITNITEDHLNRHHTMEEYIRVKELITKNQTAEDLCVLNYEDAVLRAFGETLSVPVTFFSSLRVLERGLYVDQDAIWISDASGVEKVIDTASMKLLGLHNFENAMCAIAMALHAGVELDVIRRVLREFAGVEHRIEFVTEKNGVAYYNDSKGTNPDAAIKGIQAMNRKTLLIGGGYDKQSTYGEWIESFDGKVRYLVLIGQTREKIRDTAIACGFDPEHILLCEDLEEAVQRCADLAEEGDAVLLSPACASWGQFDNYEQRGDLFKEYVRRLPQQRG